MRGRWSFTMLSLTLCSVSRHCAPATFRVQTARPFHLVARAMHRTIDSVRTPAQTLRCLAPTAGSVRRPLVTTSAPCVAAVSRRFAAVSRHCVSFSTKASRNKRSSARRRGKGASSSTSRRGGGSSGGGGGGGGGKRPRLTGDASMKARGDRLEKRVVTLLKRLGRLNVQRSVVVVDIHGNRSEIDVMYGFVFKTYVECKNYTGPVPLEQVAKFKEVLALNGIPARRGIFITNSYYVPRAKHIGIKCIDGEELAKLERTATMKVWSKRLVVVWALGAGAILAFGPEDGVVGRLRDAWKHAGEPEKPARNSDSSWPW